MYKGKLIKRSKLRRRVNNNVMELLRWLYNSGDFGNLSKSKSIDGIVGPRTRKAMESHFNNLFKFPFLKKEEKITSNKSNSKYSGMSLEEYKEMKRDEIRKKAARVNSLTITPDFPIMSGGPMKGHDLDVYGKKKWDEERVKKEFSNYIVLAESYLKSNPNIEPLAKQRILNTINYYKKVVADPHYIDKYGGGFGCIYTASGAYGDLFRYASNSDLANKTIAGKDTGFKLVNDSSNYFDWKIGDIIQIGKSEKGNSPHHALMVVSKSGFFPVLSLTNARGYGPDDKENDVPLENYLAKLEWDRKHGKSRGSQILRFVGTKALNKLWEKEYYAIQKGKLV